MTPTTVPTFTLIDSAGMQKFEDQMDAYYAPPKQPIPQPFDPSGMTPDAIEVENIDEKIEDVAAENRTEWRNYKAWLHIWTIQKGVAGLPHPPAYRMFVADTFHAVWKAWNDFNSSHPEQYTEFKEFCKQHPAFNYTVPVDPPPPPIIKLGADAATPPPTVVVTDLVGAYAGQGMWFATPFAVQNALQAQDPNLIFIDDSRSPTGRFRLYKNPFANAGFWIPVPKA